MPRKKKAPVVDPVLDEFGDPVETEITEADKQQIRDEEAEKDSSEPPAEKAGPPVDKRPHYKCHKEVRAHQIAGVKHEADGAVVVTPAEPGFTQIRLAPGFHAKEMLIPGSYLVYYSDGYVSVSPAGAFESGYTLIK